MTGEEFSTVGQLSFEIFEKATRCTQERERERKREEEGERERKREEEGEKEEGGLFMSRHLW